MNLHLLWLHVNDLLSTIVKKDQIICFKKIQNFTAFFLTLGLGVRLNPSGYSGAPRDFNSFPTRGLYLTEIGYFSIYGLKIFHRCKCFIVIFLELFLNISC